MQEITVYDIYGNSITSLVQWDEDIIVCIEEAEIDSDQRVHFFNTNMNESLVVDGTYAEGILKSKIPNILLTEKYPIIGYVYVSKNNESRSIYGFKIQVRERPKPNTYVYVDSVDYVRAEKILDECIEYARLAELSAANSQNYATRSKTYSSESQNYSIQSKSYAVGGTSTRTDEDTDNSKYYYELSKTKTSETLLYSTNANDYMTAAKNYAQQAGIDADAIASQKQSLITATANANNAANNANSAAQTALDSISNIGETKVIFSNISGTEDFSSGESLASIIAKIKTRINYIMSIFEDTITQSDIDEIL